MPTPEIITGETIVSVGYTVTLSDATAGGTWSSSNDTLATVSASGVVTGVAVGAVVITYTTIDGYATHSMQVYPKTISNGFQVNEILPTLQGRIGWMPSTITGMPVIDADNNRAISGRYYNDYSGHVAVTIENIKNMQQNAELSDDEFNTMLDTLDKSVIMRTLNAVFNRPALIEKKTVYTRTWTSQDIIIQNGTKGVGYRINVGKGNYAVNLDAVSLYFDGEATFNLYVFNDLLKDPIKTISVTTVANSQTRVEIDLSLNYVANQNMGGVVFLWYSQSDIESQGVHAIDEQFTEWSNTNVFGVNSFIADLVGDDDFNRKQPSISNRTFGLNLEVSAYRDYTRMIVQNSHLFDEARVLTMAITVLSLMKYTNRNNDTQRDTATWLRDIKMDLDQAEGTADFPYVSGLKQQLVRAFKTLNDNFWAKPVAGSIPITGGCCVEYLGMNANDLPRRQY